MKTYPTPAKKQRNISIKLVFIYLNFIALLFVIQMLNAQVVKFDDYIQELKMQKSAIKIEEANHLNSLAYDLHPTFYVNSNQIISTDSETPICGEIDYDEFHLLSSSNSKFEDVEFLTIHLRSIKTQKLNLNLLYNLQSLKYINFICEYSCNSSSIEQLLEGNNTKIKIFYSIIIPN